VVRKLHFLPSPHLSKHNPPAATPGMG
jgi:hypothetical protein